MNSSSKVGTWPSNIGSSQNGIRNCPQYSTCQFFFRISPQGFKFSPAFWRPQKGRNPLPDGATSRVLLESEPSTWWLSFLVSFETDFLATPKSEARDSPFLGGTNHWVSAHGVKRRHLVWQLSTGFDPVRWSLAKGVALFGVERWSLEGG